MNILKIDTHSKFKLRNVISIYQRDSGNDSINSKFYLESQEIQEVNDQLIFSEAKPLRRETLDDLATYLHGRDNSSLKGFVPQRLLYQDPTIGKKIFIWYREAQTTHMKFSEKKNLPKDSHIHLPALVFKAHNKNLSVWAIKTKKASAKTELYKAPLLNVSQGRICLGTTRKIIEDEIDNIHDINELLTYWEDMLFASAFNTGDGLCEDAIKGKQGVIQYYKKAAKEQLKFDTELLVPTTLKVKNLID